jgi:hypothetical protein
MEKRNSSCVFPERYRKRGNPKLNWHYGSESSGLLQEPSHLREIVVKMGRCEVIQNFGGLSNECQLLNNMMYKATRIGWGESYGSLSGK